MSVRQDVVNLVLNINGNAAQNQLNELRKRAADLAHEMKTNKKGTDEYIAAAKALKTVKADMADLKKEIGITSLSQKELVAELKKLQAMKGSMTPFTQEFKDMQRQIEAVERRLYDVRNGVTGLASVFSRVKDEVKQFGMMAAGYLGFQFITSQFKNIITGAGRLSDQLADIRRVAGMTASEVDELNQSLSRLDTRTSMSGLREISIIAGKLGVAKQDIAGFTAAVDMLTVTLGDELGSADQITTQLGKILNVFDGKVTGENVTKLGNAFVELANSGVATGGFIADFDQRLSGIAKSANIGLGALSGLGAGLEELGSRVESSATAVQKLIVKIAGDIPKAAGIAGVSVEDFSKLFAEDATEALLKYSEGLVKNKNAFNEVVEGLQEAGESGQRVIETIGKLGGSADLLRVRIKQGSEAIQETSAIMDGFALKNETLGASLDKLGKDFYKFIMQSGIVGFLKNAVMATIEWVRWLKDLPSFIQRNRITISLLITALIAMNRQLFISNGLWLARKIALAAVITYEKAYLIIQAAMKTGTLAMAAAQALLAGNTARAAAALRMLSTVIRTSPVGLLVTAALALGMAMDKLFSKVKAVGSAYKETVAQATKDLAKQKSEIDTLTRVVKDNTLALDARKKALANLIALNPEYLSGLTLENINLREGKRILEQYNELLETNARLKAANNIKDSAFEKKTDLEMVRQELAMAQKSGKGYRELSSDARDMFSKLTTSVGRANNIAYLFNSIPSAADFKQAFDEVAHQLRDADAMLSDATDNYLDQQRHVDQARQRFLLSQVATARKTMQQFKKGTEEYTKAEQAYLEATEKYRAEFGNPKKQSLTGGVEDSSSVAARRKYLEGQIKMLQEQYELLNKEDIAGQKKNLAQQKKFQDELDALDHKESKAARGEYERLLKEAEAFYKQIQRLKEDAVNASKSDDERELTNLQRKYEEMQAKALEFFRKNVISQSKYQDQAKILTEAFNLELEHLHKKQFDKTSEQEYARALQDTKDHFEAQRNLAGRHYADGKKNKIQYDAEITSLDLAEKAQLVRVANNYVATVIKAEGDLHTFKKDEEKATTQEAIEQAELRIKVAKSEALSKAQLAVIASPEGSEKRLQAEKNLLRLQFEQDTEFLDKRSEAYLLAHAQLNEALERLDEEARQRRLQAFDEFAQQLLSITDNFINALSNLDQREIESDKEKNEAKKNNYKKQLDGKLLSQRQYDKRIAEADAELDKKRKEMDLRAFKRQQALAVTAALINGALAVTSTLAARPGLADIFTLGTARAIQVGLVVAATAAQVAAIATQKPPTAARGRWFRKGKKHKDGGIQVEIERDEAVIMADAMTDTRKYTVSGTPAQITSRLNSMHGGVGWAPGANLQPRFRERPAAMNPGLPRIMEQGGIVRNMISLPEKSENESLLKQLIAKQDELITEVKNQKDRLHAVVSIKEFRNEEKKYDNARRAAGMDQ